MGMSIFEHRKDPELQHMTDASMRALDGPGGEEILDRMLDGSMSIVDGMVSLLIMSGDFERIDGTDSSRIP